MKHGGKMRNNLNTVLLLVAILLLAYIGFLKPQPQRFAKTRSFYLLVDTATGTLCDARTPSKEAIKLAHLRIEALQSPPLGFVLENPEAVQESKDALYNLLHPSKQYPLCSEF